MVITFEGSPHEVRAQILEFAVTNELNTVNTAPAVLNQNFSEGWYDGYRAGVEEGLRQRAKRDADETVNHQIGVPAAVVPVVADETPPPDDEESEPVDDAPPPPSEAPQAAPPPAPAKEKRGRGRPPVKPAPAPASVVAAPPAAPPVTDPFPIATPAVVAPSEPAPSFDPLDPVGALKAVNSKRGLPTAREVLQKFKAARISEVPADKFPEFVKACEQACAGA